MTTLFVLNGVEYVCMTLSFKVEMWPICSQVKVRVEILRMFLLFCHVKMGHKRPPTLLVAACDANIIGKSYLQKKVPVSVLINASIYL